MTGNMGYGRTGVIENANYYAVIPAIVRYDKELSPLARLMYGEIAALSNKEGYCWANNSYFAELYNVTKETVSRWLAQLEKKKYIKTTLIYKNGTKQIINRHIYIFNTIDGNINTLLTKKSIGIDKNINTPIDKKIKDNNTSNNNTSNNINIRKKTKASAFRPPTSDEVREYCLERNNNVDAERFVNFYQSKGWQIGKNKMKDWKAAVRTWEKNTTKSENSKSRYNSGRNVNDVNRDYYTDLKNLDLELKD